MDNEKMMILKMLETGKISSAEAAQLLQTMESNSPPPPPPPPKSPPPPPRPATSTYESSRSNNGPAHSSSPGVGRDLNELANDLGKKVGAFARDMEPKIQKFTETVASTIVGGADKISRTIQESSAQPVSRPTRPAPVKPPVKTPVGVVTKEIEMTVADGYNELNLSGINGELLIKGYNGDKITATVSYKTRKAGAAIDMMKLGGRYYLNYEQDDFEQVSINAYVPERMFKIIKLDNLNGTMDISSLSANEIILSNANGNTRLASLAAVTLKAESSNGRLTLSSMAADNADIENVNGLIEAEEMDVAHLKLTNFNGPLSLWISDFTRYTQYDWSVETGNAKLNMNLPAAPDLGYHIKARATMSEIKLGLTGLQYIINDPAHVEARSVQFDMAGKQIRLNVETSNAPLTIN